MSSTRTRLTLDEQSFQGLLAAAFTIQEHNDKRRLAPPSPTAVDDPRPGTIKLCDHCGATLTAANAPCPTCGPDKLRPGERLQRTWASMWLMSQEQGMWSDPSAKTTGDPASGNSPSNSGHAESSHDLRAGLSPQSSPDHQSSPRTLRIQESTDDVDLDDRASQDPGTNDRFIGDSPPPNLAADNSATEDFGDGHLGGSDLALRASNLHYPDLDLSELNADWPSNDAQVSELTGPSAAHTPEGDLASSGNSIPRGFWDLRVKLRFHRADLYLGMAIFVAVVALLWPAAAAPQRPKLHPWEKMLIAMGIAEAPQPAAHFRGDPNIKVWVDTHTALYYCPGAELYGKSADGHYSTQREAQSDSFEPAERSVCVE